MRTIISTADVAQAESLDFWQDIVCRTFFVADCEALSERPFHGSIATAATRQMAISRLRSCAQHVVRDAAHVRRTPEEVFLINLQVSGTGAFEQNGRQVVLRPGDLTCSDSTRPCEMHYTGDFEQLVFYMPRQMMARAMGDTEHLTACAIPGESPIGSIVAPFLRQMAAQIGKVQATTAARLADFGLSLVMTALGEVAGGDHEPGRWSRIALRERANQIIDAHAADPELNPSVVAAALGISLRYLQDIFRDGGTTPSDWIWARRLEKSRRDLCSPALAAASVSQIAFACGFSDLAHFSRRFKAAYGMSPRDYRAENKF
jgi:AraC-like DNA-binding protein/mannose-6-phosphate isomerase-like protein (cupin superfamily)